MAGKYLILAIAIPTIAVAISVSSNGNSPQRKILGGMMVDVQKGFVPMKPTRVPDTTFERNRKRYNGTGLAINERYRRLIPYMTFYYANDLVGPTKESYSTPTVEVQKVNIQEKPMPILESKVGNSQLRNVPVYRGNRLTQYNIASANPNKLIQYARPPPFQPSQKLALNENLAYINPSTSSTNQPTYNPNLFYYKTLPDYTRKPSTVSYQATENPIVQYYQDGQNQDLKYKLVPYDQTPPIQMQGHSPNYQVYNEQLKPPPQAVAVNQSPTHTQQNYVQRPQQYKSLHVFKEPELTTSDSYSVADEVKYENVQNKQAARTNSLIVQSYKPENNVLQHSVETDFVPIFNPNIAPLSHRLQKIQIAPEKPLGTIKVINPTTPVPEYSLENESDSINYDFQPEKNYPNIEVAVENNNITSILETLQSGKKPTKENLTASIRTLLNILNSLKSNDQQYYELNTVEPILSTPTPFAGHTPRPVIIEKVNEKIPLLVNSLVSAVQKPILSPIIHRHPSQYLDADYSIQPQPPQSDDDYSEEDTPEGGTPGIPGVDYPLFTSIPETSFDCKTQRYKGFFGDPETNCQVWHYCDLNGGQASFLCPNGTIFSQVALTCDWWFNVKCSTTTQLYVLNERLYKYILPFTPKFPEDYSGPLVDKYLTIKFKEMEEKFKKNKKKNPTPTAEPVEITEEKTPMVEVVTSSKNGELTPYKEEEPQ